VAAKRSRSVAVVGATGVVGQTIATVLEERRFTVTEFFPVATVRSEARRVEAHGRAWEVRAVEDVDFGSIDYAFFTAGAGVSQAFVPRAVEAGCRVIDNTSAFRMDPQVPLVVPEINGARIDAETRLVACPNCTTINLVMALWPIARTMPIIRVVVTSFQSVSGAGRAALADLEYQTRAALDGRAASFEDPPVFEKPIAFNCLPKIGDLTASGNTGEEEKVIAETRKILDDPGIDVVPTCVRVPVHVGHALSVNIELAGPLSIEEARDLWRRAPGVEYDDGLPTPLDVAGRDSVVVGRARIDRTRPHAMTLWVVGDNLRKGAATNSVQIAELMVLESAA